MNQLAISAPDVSYDPSRKTWRIDCDVAGENLYFESNIELVPAAEGIVSAFFAQSLKRESPLVSEAPLDQNFMDNLKTASNVLNRYWGYAGPAPHAASLQRTPDTKDGAIFFTGGIDSFYTLQENLHDVRYLVNVHGFDVQLDDDDRRAHVVDGLQRVATSLGLDLIQVETNLRTLNVFRELPWDRVYIMALAAVGHLLQNHVDRIYVAGGYQSAPSGSTPELDVLWSSSTFRMIRAEEPDRQSKIEAIVDWPPVKSFLSVCWQHLNLNPNCGECEKCLRTQLGIIAAGGDLDDFEAFPKVAFETQLAKLKYISPAMRETWVVLSDQTDEPEFKKIISRVLLRSRIKSECKRWRFKMLNLQTKLKRRFGRLTVPRSRVFRTEAQSK